MYVVGSETTLICLLWALSYRPVKSSDPQIRQQYGKELRGGFIAYQQVLLHLLAGMD